MLREVIAWVFRTVRGALLVALVFAVVWSANQLLASTRSAPSAADRSAPAAAQIDNAAPAADVSTSADVTSAADQTALAQTVDVPPDSADASHSAATAASALADSPNAVDLAVQNVPDSAATASTGQYKRVEIAKLGYGSGDAEVGRSTGSERRPVGPTSFAVDGSGALYVSDNVNGRVQAYSAQGKHVGSLKVDTYVYDLTSDQSSALYFSAPMAALSSRMRRLARSRARRRPRVPSPGSSAGCASWADGSRWCRRSKWPTHSR